MDHIAAARDQLSFALTLIAAIGDAESPRADRAIRLAQTHALVAIAEGLALPSSAGPAAEAAGGAGSRYESHVAQYVSGGYPEEEARILALPQPKSHRCPVCTHNTSIHRMHGCDSGDCECPQPHGRVLPGDPPPTT